MAAAKHHHTSLAPLLLIHCPYWPVQGVRNVSGGEDGDAGLLDIEGASIWIDEREAGVVPGLLGQKGCLLRSRQGLGCTEGVCTRNGLASSTVKLAVEDAISNANLITEGNPRFHSKGIASTWYAWTDAHRRSMDSKQDLPPLGGSTYSTLCEPQNPC